jgi:hypothetical protein
MMTADPEYTPIPLDRRGHARRRVAAASAQGAELLGRGNERPVGTFFARIFDLSTRGMRIHTECALALGHTYWFRLGVPGRGGPVRVRGEVAWLQTEGPRITAGISFLPVSDARRDELDGLLAELDRD